MKFEPGDIVKYKYGTKNLIHIGQYGEIVNGKSLSVRWNGGIVTSAYPHNLRLVAKGK